ncbi:MAG TPA: cation-transporting P-type ATPase, partial [bacterium]|nr:cation-transporting P-type ATPase [bacterium]
MTSVLPPPAVAPPASVALKGLDESEARARRARLGANRLTPAHAKGALLHALEPLTDPMALMLAGTSAAYFALGEARDGWIMAGALVPVLAVDVALEARSRRALAALASATAARVRVLRGDTEISIATADVVPGDVVLLQEGDVVPADGAVLRATNLLLDEAHLTGESEPLPKRALADPGPDVRELPADVETVLFAGARVLSGTAAARVITTGAATKFGKIAALVAATEEESTPLQKRVARAFRVAAIIAVALAAAVLALGIVRGQAPASAFLSAASLAMAAIPEEFPLVLTLFLAVGAFRLGKKGVLVRRLAAVETLGSTTVLCLDKTGTITAGAFELEEVRALSGDERTLLEASVLACEESPIDPLERAIVARAARAGIEAAASRARWPMVQDYDFDPVTRCMSHVRRGRIDAKGALEGVLGHCRIDETERARALALETELASRGMRVLGVATRGGADFSGVRARDERDLELLGLLAFRDPIRPDVPAAVATLQAAGIRLLMLTGDHALTATSIGAAAGLPSGADRVLTGADVDALTAEDLAERLARASVIARLRPEQKHDIVRALQRRGEVVAMTGDGVNDAPALRQADIGVSMGPRATEVARASADIVLLEDRVSALADVAAEGRAIFDNLRRAFLFLIAFHTPIILLAVIPPVLGMPLLFLPVHLVWLELVVHPVSALVFDERGESARGLMLRPPRRFSEGLVTRTDLLRSGGAGLSLTAAAFVLWLRALGAGDPSHARALGVVTVVFGSAFLAVAERRRSGGGLVRARSVLLILSVLVSGIAAVTIPAVADAIGFSPL